MSVIDFKRIKMKILPVFLVCLTFLITGNVYSQNYYYYHGSKIPIQKIDNKILISSNREKWFNNSRVGLTATYKQNERNFNKNRILSPEIRYEMVLSKEEWQSEFRPFLTHNVIVSPFYRVHDSIVGSSIYFYVCLYESEDFEKLQKYALNNKIRIVAQDQFMPEWYILAVTDSCSLNSVQAANLFYESNMFKFATPDWRTENNT